MSVPPSNSRRGLARAVGILVSGALLVALYRTFGIRSVGATLLAADPGMLALSIGAILPITALRAVRFLLVVPSGVRLGLGEALRLTLVSSAANLVLPAKAGDLIKSYSVAGRGEATPGVSVAIVFYERLCDMAAVIAWCLAGWVVGRPQVPGLPSAFWGLLGVLGVVCAVLISSEYAAGLLTAVFARLRSGRFAKAGELAEGWPGLLRLVRGRRRLIVAFSLALWLAHLFQIWLFTVALGVPVPFLVCTSLSAVALMAGLVPITVAGLGTRDVALVVLLANYMAPEAAAAMGILIATRGLVPALLGIPLMWPYVSKAVRA